MSLATFAEWFAFYSEFPWGELRADMRSAKAVFDTITRQNSKEQVKMKDLILKTEKEEQDMAEAEAKMTRMATMQGRRK